MELNRDGAIRVHECGVREGRHPSAIKGNFDVPLRQPLRHRCDSHLTDSPEKSNLSRRRWVFPAAVSSGPPAARQALSLGSVFTGSLR